ncbi:N-acetyl-1-D-myo-inositol-2-amino-2-deoxy-alpha-D-glucopyranoside deacetylase [Nocardioides sp. BE266]|uniref:N-acetyl-1-D-myo-inositol-2-amino-2-deoxy-alpha- D-glucopyranoside deacetylase n=1 Tax=Nocardioides sp. BE266 TaxID=2817725 RepID=UPI00285E5E22|nr:N-acetyl-1-D-myo-inositol-2-amino-2-deoxy-alpha-D-glucopyranoside deacetylase [Nocardioides sp. BE266]MDR7252627.1 N-acetyl-1-D-myo-inositol-2-amino-2-deoxy-alpha-D-glucopyranoside deacetylase [Nocardioides sp. BE266]
MTADRRIMLVHAHPDDESINNGATMARYVDEGVAVTLVTCTAGEMGEVLVPDLAYLAFEEKGGLGEHRREELVEAMKVLGVTDHRFLGGFGRFHDSGMAWHEDGHAIPAEEIPDNAFWTTDLVEAADELVKVIREVRPQVLVTYDQFGGYGHPDHIQAHRVAMYGAQLAAAPSYKLELGVPHDVAKIYWTAMSESRMRESLRKLREAGDTETFAGMDPDGKLPPFVTPDELISARVDGAATVQRKMDALAKHETQVQSDGPFFSGAESGHSWWSEEFYRLVKGTAGPTDAEGFEADLFAGL